ncbi:MAG: hypothetical protein QM726_09405 [Chitinophagaceae bacterium]
MFPIKNIGNINRIAFLLLLVISFLFGNQHADAQTIGNWTFNSTLVGTPGSYNTVSNSDFSPSVPIRTFNGGTEYYGENGWPSGGINTSMYLEFSLTPSSGYQLDISSIVLTMRRSNTGSPAGSGPTSWSIRSSLDGFAADIASGSMTLTYANYTVTPGAAFTNRYTTVTFRVYGYNVSIGSGGNSRMVFDNIRVNGIGYLLPSRLGSFAANISAQKVNLAYTVYNVSAGDKYTIERSTDGSSFSGINTTTSATDAAEQSYTYTDDISNVSSSTGNIYYRLHLVNNTSNNYSSLAVVKASSSNTSIKAFATNKQLHINGSFPVAGNYQAFIYNSGGQQLGNFTLNAYAGYNTFTCSLDKAAPGSISIVQVKNNQGFLFSSRFIND